MLNLFFCIASGIFIIAVAIGFAISQIGITKLFQYPQILRQSTQEIFEKYNSCRKKIKMYWVIFSFCSLMLIALSGIFYKLLDCENTPYLLVGTFFGISASIFYVLGLMRWVMLADTLSAKYMMNGTSKQEKESLINIFEAFHIYCGNSIGETMGFVCMGIWISIVGIAIVSTSLFPFALGLGYIVCGIGTAIAPLEWIGLKLANKVNKISMKILMMLFIINGIILIIS